VYWNNTLWPVTGISSTVSTINVTDVYMGAIFAPTPGKTITKIGWYASSASGSPVVDVRLETVSGGLPTNTLVTAGAELTGQSIASSTWYNHTLGSSYVVPTGATSLVAGTIRYVSGTSLAATIRTGLITMPTTLPRPFYYSAGVPISTTATMPAMCLEYSDGTISNSFPMAASQTNTSFNSTSNPDEYGMVFVPPHNVWCTGIASIERINAAAANVRYRILDANLNVLTTDSELTLTQQMKANTGNQELTHIMFQTPIALVAGQTYYITKAATTSDANTCYTYTSNFNSVAHRSVWYNFAYQCSRQNDTGAFTTNTTKIEQIAPIVDGSFSNRITVG
jgi:hypothetical protein